MIEGMINATKWSHLVGGGGLGVWESVEERHEKIQYL